MELRDLRALERRGLKGVADLVLGRALLESLNKLVVDATLHKDARPRAAALAVVIKNAKVDPRNRILDVGIVEHDVGALAAELERDLLQVRACSSLHDLPADDGAARKGDLVDVHVRGNGSARRLAKAGQDVDDAGREAGFFDELGCKEAGQRCLLGGLEDNGVAAGDGGANLPGPHDDGEVPGNDLAADANLCMSASVTKEASRRKEAYGLAARIVEGVRVGLDDFAMDFIGPPAIVSNAADGGAKVGAGHHDALAVVERFDGCDGVQVRLHQVCQLHKVLSSLLGCDFFPFSLKGLARCGNGNVDVLFCGFVDAADDLFV